MAANEESMVSTSRNRG